MLPAHGFLLPTQHLHQAAHKLSEIFSSKKPCSSYMPLSFLKKKASWLQEIQAESRNFFPELYFPRPFCFCRCSHKPHTGAAAQTLVNLLTPQGKYRLYRTPFKSPQLKFYTFRQKSDSMFHNPSHMLLLQLPATDVWFGKRSVSSVADQYV